MTQPFNRSLTSVVLAFSLLISALAAMPAAAQEPQNQNQTEQKASTPAPSASPSPATSPAPANPGRPLSTNEDPAMIGKRNLNKGIVSKIPLITPSTEKEVAMGRQLAAEVDREAKFVDDPVVTEYINRVGQNIVLHSDAKVAFTIKVIDSDEVNAFALPGGFFYVNKGLILAADNEAELAGVMAHEIGHVAARHAVENQAKATLAQYAILIPAIVLGGGLGQIIYEGGNFGALLGFMKFSRNAEAEADRLGVQYLYASGYDPNAMATMFEKLSAKDKKKPGFVAKAFASHPAPPDRRAASLALVARFPEREEYVINTSEFQKVKARLMRLSNARATTAGDISGDNGSNGRPTLKRRQPAPDDSTTPSTTSPGATPGSAQPADKQTTEPPKLKRRSEPAAQPSPSPEDKP